MIVGVASYAARLHPLGDARVAAVGPDHEAGLLARRRCAVAGPAANTGDAVVLEGQVVDGEPLPELGAGRDGGVDEHLVERRAARAEADRHPVDDQVVSGQREVAEVHHDRGHRGTAGGQQRVEQPPAAQACRPVPVDEVTVGDLAREARAVDQEHVEPGARQQHRRRRAGAASPDDDRVVHARNRLGGRLESRGRS